MTMNETTNETELDAVLSWLGDDEQYHQEHAARARRGRAAVNYTSDLLRQYRLETAADKSGDGTTHFGVPASAIARCPTIREAMAVIACGSRGYLRYRMAAQVILAAGLSKSKNLNHLSRDLQERMKQDQDWEWVSPGVYRYLPYARRGVDKARKTVSLTPVSTAPVAPSPHWGGEQGGPS